MGAEGKVYLTGGSRSGGPVAHVSGGDSELLKNAASQPVKNETAKTRRPYQPPAIRPSTPPSRPLPLKLLRVYPNLVNIILLRPSA